jgi:hypothetical protein
MRNCQPNKNMDKLDKKIKATSALKEDLKQAKNASRQKTQRIKQKDKKTGRSQTIQSNRLGNDCFHSQVSKQKQLKQEGRSPEILKSESQKDCQKRVKRKNKILSDNNMKISIKRENGQFEKIKSKSVTDIIKAHLDTERKIAIFYNEEKQSSLMLWYGGEKGLYPYMSDPTNKIYGGFRIDPSCELLVYNQKAEPLQIIPGIETSAIDNAYHR